jgi:hypothetical protein
MPKAFFKISLSVSNSRMRLSSAWWSSTATIGLFSLPTAAWLLAAAFPFVNQVLSNAQPLGYFRDRTTTHNHSQYLVLKRSIVLAALCTCAFFFHFLLLM